jgi:hypothetical protein
MGDAVDKSIHGRHIDGVVDVVPVAVLLPVKIGQCENRCA